MRTLAAVALVTLASVSVAPAQEKNYTIVLSASQMNVVASALADQRYRDVAEIIRAISVQIEAQNKPPSPPPAADEESKK
jgi:hypothetical protein